MSLKIHCFSALQKIVRIQQQSDSNCVTSLITTISILTAAFQVNPCQTLLPQFCSSTCSAREPLRIRGTGFTGPDVHPVTQPTIKSTETNIPYDEDRQTPV